MKTTTTISLEVIPYTEYESKLPQEGNYILAQIDGEAIYVYQAFNHPIANYAVANQRFGGSAYSFSRMSWIKPNFLWMMYRAGWATKPNQERILAIKMTLAGFIELLDAGVYSSYQPRLYSTRANWKAALADSEVRIQWDPDHGPGGDKLNRRAIQIGIRGQLLVKFNEEFILSISDVTDFVHQQRKRLEEEPQALRVIKEKVLNLDQTLLTKYAIPGHWPIAP
ncbi:MAG: DUF4291 domain-containing protein [Bacteroidota bacterium]